MHLTAPSCHFAMRLCNGIENRHIDSPYIVYWPYATLLITLLIT